MAPATELATFPIASGAAVEDGDSAAGKVWQSTLDTVSQQDGFQRLYWGREVEDPSVLQLFVGNSINPTLSQPPALSTIPNPQLTPRNPHQTGTRWTTTNASGSPPPTAPSPSTS